MGTVFFFYTLLLFIVCIVTAVSSVAAWASSRRRFFLWLAGAFSLYAVETTEIFFYEYISQNQPFPLADYYDINMPVIRTLVVTALLWCIWMALLDTLDRHSKRLEVLPLVAFTALNLMVLRLMPQGPLQQWSYYSLRQAFLLFVGAYCLYVYHVSSDKNFRARLYRYRTCFIIATVLVACILIEDFYIILIRPASTQPSWLLLYLSERNISENVFMCFLAVLTIHQTYQVFSIRFKEPPVKEEVNDLERHIDEELPAYREHYKISKRESEVLRLVLLGKSTQEIANELYLATGTVKTHIHNILVKTGTGSRKDLSVHFWQH